jgi:hypothetical protein
MKDWLDDLSDWDGPARVIAAIINLVAAAIRNWGRRQK